MRELYEINAVAIISTVEVNGMRYIQTSAAGVISNQRSQRQLGSVPAAGYFNVAGYVTPKK